MYVVSVGGPSGGFGRTLAQWMIIDFVTAVATGAVDGRIAIAANQSLVTGAAALVALIAAQRLVGATLRASRR